MCSRGGVYFGMWAAYVVHKLIHVRINVMVQRVSIVRVHVVDRAM